MEITAVLEALRDHAGVGPIEIVSDSTYVVNCFRDRWYDGWRRRGWKNSQRQPVANRDLWEPLLDLALADGPEITFRWVKGHSGDEEERPRGRTRDRGRGPRQRRRRAPDPLTSADARR